MTSAAMLSSMVGAKLVTSSVRDVAAGADRTAELQRGDVADELDVLDRQRPVEAELLAHALDLLGAGLFAGQRNRRIAGDQPQRQEHDRRHAQQHRDRVGEAAQDVGPHTTSGSGLRRRLIV